MTFVSDSTQLNWNQPFFDSFGNQMNVSVTSALQFLPVFCSAGSRAIFYNGSQASSCSPCPSGTFASTNSLQCRPCPPDSFCPFASPLPYQLNPIPSWKHCLVLVAPLNSSSLGNLDSWTVRCVHINHEYHVAVFFF